MLDAEAFKGLIQAAVAENLRSNAPPSQRAVAGHEPGVTLEEGVSAAQPGAQADRARLRRSRRPSLSYMDSPFR